MSMHPMKKLSFILFVIINIFVGCTSNEVSHDISHLEGAGMWVNIKNAPPTCYYLLRGDRIYGVGLQRQILDSIDWDLFWQEFLMPRYSLITTEEEFGRTSREVVSRDSSEFCLKYVDIESFEVNINSDDEFWDQLYAKDKRYVYYPQSIQIMDEYDYFDITFEGDIRIHGADPNTFLYIGKGYAVDKKNMYYQGEKIKWNDHIIEALRQPDCPDFLPRDYGMRDDEL